MYDISDLISRKATRRQKKVEKFGQIIYSKKIYERLSLHFIASRTKFLAFKKILMVLDLFYDATSKRNN